MSKVILHKPGAAGAHEWRYYKYMSEACLVPQFSASKRQQFKGIIA
jgi:hypothetical protein